MPRDLTSAELAQVLSNPDGVMAAAYSAKLDSVAGELRCALNLIDRGSVSLAVEKIEQCVARIHALQPTTKDSASAATASA